MTTTDKYTIDNSSIAELELENRFARIKKKHTSPSLSTGEQAKQSKHVILVGDAMLSFSSARSGCRSRVGKEV